MSNYEKFLQAVALFDEKKYESAETIFIEVDQNNKLPYNMYSRLYLAYIEYMIKDKNGVAIRNIMFSFLELFPNLSYAVIPQILLVNLQTYCSASERDELIEKMEAMDCTFNNELLYCLVKEFIPFSQEAALKYFVLISSSETFAYHFLKLRTLVRTRTEDPSTFIAQLEKTKSLITTLDETKLLGLFLSSLNETSTTEEKVVIVDLLLSLHVLYRRDINYYLLFEQAMKSKDIEFFNQICTYHLTNNCYEQLNFIDVFFFEKEEYGFAKLYIEKLLLQQITTWDVFNIKVYLSSTYRALYRNDSHNVIMEEAIAEYRKNNPSSPATIGEYFNRLALHNHRRQFSEVEKIFSNLLLDEELFYSDKELRLEYYQSRKYFPSRIYLKALKSFDKRAYYMEMSLISKKAHRYYKKFISTFSSLNTAKIEIYFVKVILYYGMFAQPIRFEITEEDLVLFGQYSIFDKNSARYLAFFAELIRQKDPALALKSLKLAYSEFVNNLCSYNFQNGFLAHAYLTGLGGEVDYQAAKEVVLNTVKTCGERYSTNIAVLYGYFFLCGDKDFNPTLAIKILTSVELIKFYNAPLHYMLSCVYRKLDQHDQANYYYKTTINDLKYESADVINKMLTTVLEKIENEIPVMTVDFDQLLLGSWD